MVSRKNKTFQKHSFMEIAAFQNFIVGRSNQVAWASAKYASNNPGKYSPLFIYGSEGLGKTRLLFAVRNDMLSKNKKAKVLYAPAEKFYDDAMNAIKSGSLAYFWNKYGEMDALLIDDIQFFVGKEYAQQGFLRIFNKLHEANKQIVFASVKYPKELEGLDQSLGSGFNTGLIVDIQPPDTETKIAILESKASVESISLPSNVSSYAVSVSGSNVRELEGCLARIKAVSSITGKKITLPFAKDVLRPLMPKNK